MPRSLALGVRSVALRRGFGGAIIGGVYEPIAYFLTAHCYGTRLHGDPAGSVDDLHATPGSPLLPPNANRRRFERSLMKWPPLRLTAPRRRAVRDGVLRAVARRGWRLSALHVRTTHWHAVLCAEDGVAPEAMLSSLKAYATRQLREDGRIADGRKVWSYHGSTKYVFAEDSLQRVIHYVVEGQGDYLDPPPIWNP